MASWTRQRPSTAAARSRRSAGLGPRFRRSIIEEELSLLATAVLRVLAGDSRPQRWGAPAFERELGLVRGHLTPIRSRPLLAASFGREGFRGPVDAAPERVARQVSVNAVHVAYALRWLELSDS